MTTKIKFPYTMYCPKCKSSLKIKSPKLIGTRITCPKCQKRIDVVTPDEDAMIAYGVEAAPEPEKPPEPTEEEILAKELEKKRKKRTETLQQIWFWLTVLFLIGCVGGTGYVIYEFALVPFANEDLSMPEEGDNKGMMKEFK